MFYAAYNYTRKTNGAHRSFLFLFIAAQASFGSLHWSINITFPPLPLPLPAAPAPCSSRPLQLPPPAAPTTCSSSHLQPSTLNPPGPLAVCFPYRRIALLIPPRSHPRHSGSQVPTLAAPVPYRSRRSLLPPHAAFNARHSRPMLLSTPATSVPSHSWCFYLILPKHCLLSCSGQLISSSRSLSRPALCHSRPQYLPVIHALSNHIELIFVSMGASARAAALTNTMVQCISFKLFVT